MSSSVPLMVKSGENHITLPVQLIQKMTNWHLQFVVKTTGQPSIPQEPERANRGLS